MRGFFKSRRASKLSSPNAVIESLESRQFLAGNVIQVQLTANIVDVSFKDLQNLPIDFKVHDLIGSLSVGGENLATQTVGNRITVTGVTTGFTDISLANTTAASSLVVKSKATDFPLMSFESTGPLEMLDMRPLLLNGTIQLVAAPHVQLGDGLNATINITQNIPILNFTGVNFTSSKINITAANPTTSAVVFKANNLLDTHFTTNEWMKSLTLHSANESSPDSGGITAMSAGTINVATDYKFDLNLTPSYGVNYKALSAKFGGTGSGTWTDSSTIGSLSVGKLDTGFAGTFAGITKFNVKTEFSGALTASYLGTGSVGQDMIGATVDLTQPFAANSWNVMSFHVGNSIESSQIISDGNLGNISTMYTYYSQFAAGVNSSYQFGQVPVPTDYTSYSAIKSFTSDCPSHHNIHFIGSTVGAYTLQNIRVGTVDLDNGGIPLGFVGASMNKVSLRVNNQVLQFNSLDSQSSFDAGLLKYKLTEPSLGDLKLIFASY